MAERQVWGTDVYTDDSDVLAASIHAGWIRGAWAEDVDVSMLELNTSSAADPSLDGDHQPNGADAIDREPGATLSDPPLGGPVPPPLNRDAHITILVLPPLEKYAPCTWHGMRSRSWGDNHDGMSFKIHRIEWVNEGVESRWSEKGSQALSKRLAQKRRRVARCGVPMKLGIAREATSGVTAA